MNNGIFEFYDENQITILVNHFNKSIPHTISDTFIFGEDIKTFKFSTTFITSLKNSRRFGAIINRFDIILTKTETKIKFYWDAKHDMNNNFPSILKVSELQRFLISNMRDQQLNKII